MNAPSPTRDPMNLWLQRDPAGRLVYRTGDGREMVGVTPVSTYPLSDPGRGISLVDAQGHEALWIVTLDDVAEPARSLLAEELAQRDFRPTIERIVSVSTYSTPTEWHVVTDRGETRFTLKAEEDIRRLAGTRLLVTSSEGLAYEIKDRFGLDRASRRILERFL